MGGGQGSELGEAAKPERKGGLTVVYSYNEGRVCVVLHVLRVLSVHLSPSGNGTGIRINLQPVGSIPPNPIPGKAQALA